ncbi:MAG: cation:proton antiporter [Acidimicrobiales bacterium]
MITDPQTAVAVIAGAAIGCQMLGARLRVPSVLFLLVAGMGLGTVMDPDEIFGELLFTGVSFGVAILLFEGGTGLHWKSLGTARQPVLRLVTIGVAVSWAVGTVFTLLLFDVDTDIAVLMAAILTVSGPTVIAPLLRVVRPREPAGSVLKWEGILIDPIGASLAIGVLDAIVEERSVGRILLRLLSTFGAGAVVGAIVALVLVGALRSRLVADRLHVPLTLAAVLGAFATANLLRPEAGLLAVTLLGMAFANQQFIPAARITEFNENLGTTVLGVLFIVLGARVDLDVVVDGLIPSVLLAAVLMVLARPLAVVASTIGTQLGRADRGFLMVMAPRGVVAAAVASLFAIELDHEGIDPGPLVPTVFTVVVTTVVVTSVLARGVARRLRVAKPEPSGVAIVGGSPFAIELAERLTEAGVVTLLLGLDEEEADRAAALGLLAFQGRLDGHAFDEAIAAIGVGTGVVLSGTDHLDAFSAKRLAEEIGSANVFGLAALETLSEPGTTQTVNPRLVLPEHLNAERLSELYAQGASLVVVDGPLDEGEDDSELVCVIDAAGRVHFAGRSVALGENERAIVIRAPS